ncbi:MAG: PDZ domain-containing protein [Verrucomicrobia bacterium]|nr:MAG: PDZ domain-containing protein [Verrucomicrobiota bacterium]
MKFSLLAFSSFALVSQPLWSLEAPKKIAPLAPSQPPSGEVVPAAPSNKPEVSEQAGEAKKALRPYLGVGLDPVPLPLAKHLGLEPNSGALIRVVDPAGPAAKAGLQEADILTAIDGQKVKCQKSLCQIMRDHQVGDKIKVSYLHRGATQESTLELAGRDESSIPLSEPENEDPLMAEDMLRSLPKEMRDAIEKNLKALEGMQALPQALGAGGALPNGGPVIPELQKRIEKMLKGIPVPQELGELQAEGQAELGGNGIEMRSTLKMMDQDGNIEIHRNGDSTEAKVFDKDGNLQWSGPYQTPQDKAAAPPEIRDRLDALNIDTTGNGIQLRMLPQR